MIVIAAYVAGLFLLLREAWSWARARSSGVVHTRGHRSRKVLKAEERERFVALLDARFKAMGLGAMPLPA